MIHKSETSPAGFHSLDFQVLIGFPDEHLRSRAGISRQSPRTGCNETDGIAVME
jgi:hypothetical protein